MAIGDPSDMLGRLKGLLPPWFGGDSPLADTVFSGIAGIFSFSYSLLQFVKAQGRRETAEGGFLDLLGWDYFSGRFMRPRGQPDALWRQRIADEVRRPRNTRPAIIQAVQDLTGQTPIMVEFTNPQDCGSYGGPYVGYGYAGSYGTLLAHTQCFLTAFRPQTTGIPEIPGYGSTHTAFGHYLAGYGITGEYASLSMIDGIISDADIYATVAATQAAGVIVWTQIKTAPDDASVCLDFSQPKNSQYIL